VASWGFPLAQIPGGLRLSHSGATPLLRHSKNCLPAQPHAGLFTEKNLRVDRRYGNVSCFTLGRYGCLLSSIRPVLGVSSILGLVGCLPAGSFILSASSAQDNNRHQPRRPRAPRESPLCRE